MALSITVGELKQRERLYDALMASESFDQAIALLKENLTRIERVALANETLPADDLLEALQLATHLALDPLLKSALMRAEELHGLPRIVRLRFALRLASLRENASSDACSKAIARRVLAALSGPKAALQRLGSDADPPN